MSGEFNMVKKNIIAIVVLLSIFVISVIGYKESYMLIAPGSKASATDMAYRGFFEIYSQAVFEGDIMKINVLTGRLDDSIMICKKDGEITKFNTKLGEIYENGKFKWLLKSDDGKIECVYYGRVDDEWKKCTLEIAEEYQNNSFFGELNKFTLVKVTDNPIMAIQRYFQKTFTSSNGDDSGYYEIEQIYYDVIEKNDSSEKVKIDGVLIHYNKDGEADGRQKEYKKVFNVKFKEDKYEIYDEKGDFVYLTYIQE